MEKDSIDFMFLIGKTIQVQEPSQKFSCDCYIVDDVVGKVIKLELANGDELDGKKIEIELAKFETFSLCIIEDEPTTPSAKDTAARVQTLESLIDITSIGEEESYEEQLERIQRQETPINDFACSFGVEAEAIAELVDEELERISGCQELDLKFGHDGL